MTDHQRNRKRNRKLPREGTPPIPVKLSALARAHWRRVVPLLRGMRVLTVADGDALAGYCTALAQWELAVAEIEKQGIVIITGDVDGVTHKVNPAVRIQSDALRHMRAFEDDFGLNPASRRDWPNSPAWA